MKLWLIERNGPADHDEFQGAVVVAEDEAAAINFAYEFCSWGNDVATAITYLGDAVVFDERNPPFCVLSDFNAG